MLTLPLPRAAFCAAPQMNCGQAVTPFNNACIFDIMKDPGELINITGEQRDLHFTRLSNLLDAAQKDTWYRQYGPLPATPAERTASLACKAAVSFGYFAGPWLP